MEKIGRKMLNKKLTRKQQLIIIEGLTLAFDNSDKSYKLAEDIIGNIYKIAHLNGSCSNPHLDWHKKGVEFAYDFHKRGII